MRQEAAPVRRDAPKRRVGHRRFWASLGLSLFVIIVTLAGLGLSGRSIPLPAPLVGLIEDRANAILAGRARLRIGSGDLVVSHGFVPQVSLGDVTLISATGQRLAAIEDLRTALDGAALLNGQLVPSEIRIIGARIAIRRTPDGALDISPGAASFSGEAVDPAVLLDAVDAAFSEPTLAQLAEVKVEGLALLFDDRRARQVWTIDGGALTLSQSAAALQFDLQLNVAGQTAAGLEAAGSDRPRPATATAVLHLSTNRETSAARIVADLSGISARDLAGQVPALAWLGALDAPISGRLESGFDPAGALSPIAVALSIGSGALQPTPDTQPVPFDAASLQLRFDPAEATLHLEALSIRSAVLEAALTGTAWLKDFRDGIPGALVAQAQLSKFRADADGLFADPVDFSGGTLDAKLTLNPFELKIGQMTLLGGESRFSAKGNVTAETAGWQVALDLAIDRIEAGEFLALWPLKAVPKTRHWIAENVSGGTLSEVQAALRFAPGAQPRMAVDFHFDGAQVRYMKTLPPITGGSGYATIDKDAFVLVAERGTVRAPTGGDIDISGSVLRVPDIRQKPAPMEVTLKTASSVTAALSILDEKPFGFLTKAGQPVDLAQGQARLLGTLRFTPKARLTPGDVRFDFSGTLDGVSSNRIVKGRTLAADRLTAKADNAGIELAGPATFDGVPVEGAWRQLFGPEGKGRSTVEGVIELSPATLKTFSIGLPDGAVQGRGQGRFRIALERGKAPGFSLESDLRGLVLSIPEVSWAKAEGTVGRLALRGRLGTPASVERLEIEVDGLKAVGSVVLKPDGSLDKVDLPEASLADWFAGSLAITGRGKGEAAEVAITGGSADLRRATFGTGGGEGGGSDRPPLQVSLGELRISEGIALADFRGTFDGSADGLGGQFTGLVNSQAPVAGTMAPDPGGGSAIRITSDDAGGALAAAGVYSSGRGGAMDLTLRPTGDEGRYDGTIRIADIRVVNAPGLAGLLNAISVVGLIDELRGAGIVFTDVEGRFGLTPDGVEIREGSAVGPSLGVSLAGVYAAGEERFDLQGVISPLYLVNGIGQIFSRQRDGLFGFSYTLKGTRTAYKVGVNPLSILTPGMFRDIFRRPPPKFVPNPGG